MLPREQWAKLVTLALNHKIDLQLSYVVLRPQGSRIGSGSQKPLGWASYIELTEALAKAILR